MVVVRHAAWLLDLVRRADALELSDGMPREVAFFDARPPFPLTLPWTSPDGRLCVLTGDHRHAVTSFHDESGRAAATPRSCSRR